MKAIVREMTLSADTGVFLGGIIQVGGRLHRIGTVIPVETAHTIHLKGAVPIQGGWLPRGKGKSPIFQMDPRHIRMAALRLMDAA